MNKHLDISLNPLNPKSPNDNLYTAVMNKNINAVTNALNDGADIDVCYSDGMTPLMIAICQRSKDIAMLLIEKGADINAKTTDPFTPLIYAAVQGFPDIVELLIKMGADVSICGGPPNHLTAYEYAKKYAHNQTVKTIEQAK